MILPSGGIGSANRIHTKEQLRVERWESGRCSVIVEARMFSGGRCQRSAQITDLFIDVPRFLDRLGDFFAQQLAVADS